MEPPAPVRPAYDGAGVSNLIPALLGARDVAWLPAPVRDAQTVVLLVIDGLGWEALTGRPHLLPELTALTGGPITTVAPSTTASALTSITTGRPPAEHGVIGFRIVVDQIVLNVLSWHASSGRRTPEPFTVQRHPPFFGREVDVVTKAEFARTGFTEAHLRGARFHGWKAVSSLVEHCRALAAARTPFVYAYYDGVDAVAHARGLHDGFYDAELRFADRLVGDLRDALPEEAALAIVSDHGQVHVGREGWRDLDGIAGCFERGSGDGR
ncbi:MAG TPA: alkaline phosphatase family protein, partial [Acidimicrobiia bacterium]|nr:alkaline phosphatase family protein [Acidimicrobiia bacterium]